MRIRRRMSGVVLVVVALVGAATAPCVLACSCIAPRPLAESVEPGTTVVVGRVGAPVGDRYSFVVERWFTGSQPTPILSLQGAEQRLPDGTVVHNTCGRSFAPGQHLILVGSQTGRELETSICGLGADVGSADGQQLLAEAQRLFGEGVTPDAPEPTDPAPTPGGFGLLPIVLLGAAGVGLGSLAVGSVVLLARQRRNAAD